ncbi:hypothetical protein LQ327_26755 [Actinomycetospora endophytica]|uniref:Uncharacterized protein n=1 Tax=Actinomycetospora endophytica TaxID=2291215 RepID=A0ABS8PHY4_9PSEU|nr:hypothetical protein [Actinomycetospora endophytica]MCD2196976.1 hypothetical protein [Actinomycetospora endophytica]
MTTTTEPVDRRVRTVTDRRAAWTLVALAPLSAEATFSGISTPFIWLGLLLLVPMYGGGALLVRELARRSGTGWPGMLVLGLAYELAEDGIGLQDLTSTHLYTAADWGPRVLGLNTTFWEAQLGYHLVFTVLIPIALTEMMFREHGPRPYHHRRGLVVTAGVFVVGVALVRAFPASQDPGYHLPWSALVGFLAAIAVLATLALAVLPRLGPVRPSPVVSPPGPRTAALVSGVTTLVFLGLIWPLGPDSGHPAVGSGAWVWIPMVAALGVAVAVGWRVARWCATDGFDDHHRIWLIGGALVAHTVNAAASGIVGGSAALSTAIAAVVLAATVLALRRLDRHVARGA